MIRPLVIASALVVACALPPAPPAHQVSLSLGDSPVALVDERFLSFSIDTAQVVGGVFWDPRGEVSLGGSVRVPPFDFARPLLRTLTRALAPAFLRIGGTAADETAYFEAPSAAYRYTLTRAQWDHIGEFARALDLKVLFTLNAGAGPRRHGAWLDDQARTLIRYTRWAQIPVEVWELGNEVNAYGLMFKLFVSAEQYAEDLRTARALIASEDPSARLAGPSVAFWPVLGDMSSLFGPLMTHGGESLQISTWHYYPQQSRRCPIAARRAGPDVLMRKETLDEVARWAGLVEQAVKAHAPRSALWLGETGNAQCGGEPGVSDAVAGSFWWLDQLGQLARRGHQVVVRQTLAGSNYGLLDETTLEPNPDYWASLLWRRLMGRRVLGVTLAPDDGALRVYAHCSPVTSRATVLALNLDRERTLRLNLPTVGGRELYLLTSDGLGARSWRLNGTELRLVGGALPTLEPLPLSAAHLDLPPLAIAFAVGTHAACR